MIERGGEDAVNLTKEIIGTLLAIAVIPYVMVRNTIRAMKRREG
jgi:hypothetical protein